MADDFGSFDWVRDHRFSVEKGNCRDPWCYYLIRLCLHFEARPDDVRVDMLDVAIGCCSFHVRVIIMIPDCGCGPRLGMATAGLI